ncbi:AAA family ATPase [Synechococcus sp. CS-1328]|uniref:AAA family ATPase n=1 Tax=Synechococcus sp. CS-1328 TaxID=2847976 RepID=UPI00223C38C2|nr:AAA family ATPase [Synechococcus sp. CS-1328]MCT0226006.1 AAA family ATPase [Synechococcus sp. CS-1328]
MLVGGNGAGKSTFYRLYLQPLGVPFVNADVLASVAYPDAPEAHSYEAAKLAEDQRNNLLLRGLSFCFETVYSHHSKIDFVGHAKALGYQVIMVMIHLQSPSLNQARISERVSEGGHDVPADKVVSRIPRMLNHVRTSLPLCDVARVYDNSSADQPFRPVFTVTHGRIERHWDPLPDWAEALLTGFCSGD